MKQTIIKLYQYNYWANHLILEKAAQVTENQFTAPSHCSSAGSLRGALVHTLSAEWIWRSRCQFGVSPSGMLQEAEFPTLASITSRWQEEENAMLAYIESLTDDDLNQIIAYTNTAGTMSFETQLGDILHHLVLHGMQHRSEMAAILTDLGQSPGNIDFIVFLRRLSS
ncbi:MAG: DinB family protein [Anaerolineae bacterium]|nr:DinB family protein [Anaerolineae bacterium]MCB0178784.1 DinB family protein [Anaerolineae bacterium]MCB0223530.1 DinB family protein [Anaerolineae bacterium]MCB9104318.1 DinB family protein [Anaerolineales bacterium]